MPTKGTRAEMIAALDDLAECGGHSFLTPDGAAKIARPFGINPPLYNATVTAAEFKGLSVPGKRDGDKVRGCDSWTLAESIATSLGATYPSMFGRGSRFRVALDAAREALK